MRRLAVFHPQSWMSVRRPTDAPVHLRSGHYVLRGLFDGLHPIQSAGAWPVARSRLAVDLETGRTWYCEGLRFRAVGNLVQILDHAWLAERIAKGERQHRIALHWRNHALAETVLEQGGLYSAPALRAAMASETPLVLATDEIVQLLVSAVAVTAGQNVRAYLTEGEPRELWTVRHVIAEIRCADPVYA